MIFCPFTALNARWVVTLYMCMVGRSNQFVLRGGAAAADSSKLVGVPLSLCGRGRGRGCVPKLWK